MPRKEEPSFYVILRKSFFKNELFRMRLSSGEIIFNCLQGEKESFSVPFSKISRIVVYEGPAREIEICTKDEVIFGNFKSTVTLNRAIKIFESFFGGKFSHVRS